MRIKINLGIDNSVSIPIEYNYNIYLNIRKTLLEFLQFNKPKLHNKFKRSFPPFTFSQLMIPKRTIEPGFIKINGNFLALFVSSIDETFMEYLVKSLNHQKEFFIYRHQFKLKKIEILEEPEFEAEMRFKMLSPLLLIKKEKDKLRFLRPGDSDLNDIFAAQLVETYNQQYRKNYLLSDIKLILDQDYLQRKTTLTKLVTIRNIHYKSILCPFTLKGKSDLIKFAYNNGIGNKTQYGFGMIEVVQGLAKTFV
jgi:CRISPR-associated endoribonuclease Cas6